ncbi:MAG TPA: DNA alkylation repair protein, partial [Planctomycetota bacterium]|nr:DNA alkylation repair protein [Planctomycetota bacterium]
REVLEGFASRIGRNHDVARALWESGIHEARLLATMTADPARLSAKDLDLWVRALDNHVIADAFARLAAQSPHALLKADEWIGSKEEWISSAGWSVIYAQVVGDGLLPPERTRPEADLPRLLARIEREIHAAPDRTRYSMNSALIGIGMRSNALEQQAVTVARRIGPVAADRGSADGRTLDAASHIPRARKYAAARQATAQKQVAPVAAPAGKAAVAASAKLASKPAAKRALKARPTRSPKLGSAKKLPVRR